MVNHSFPNSYIYFHISSYLLIYVFDRFNMGLHTFTYMTIYNHVPKLDISEHIRTYRTYSIIYEHIQTYMIKYYHIGSVLEHDHIWFYMLIYVEGLKYHIKPNEYIYERIWSYMTIYGNIWKYMEILLTLNICTVKADSSFLLTSSC